VLHIHRAERADGLADALAGILVEPPEDCLEPEVVAVHTRGMERWLSQRMSTRLGASRGCADGVCANVAFPSPRALITEVLAAACGIDPDTDPWLPERAVWPLLEVVDACLDEPWLRPLAAYLGCATDPSDPVRRARRFSVLRHLSDLFDHYALHRPEMVRAWTSGDDTDGGGQPLPVTARWQAELWRRLRAQIGLAGRAERLESACAQLREAASVVDLPARVSLFGLTRLPSAHLRVLQALAERRDVHLFLLHPSAALWDAVADATRELLRTVKRRDDPTADMPVNRLLASWARDARETQLVLGGVQDQVSHHHPLKFRSDTLLARIQTDVRADRLPPGAPPPGERDARPHVDPTDRSLEVHACHGRARQVEVLRDAVLHALADDSTLEPRDVIVMCPDIETFAPLIHATFGAGQAAADGDAVDARWADSRPVDLRVRLADRALRQTNPVLAVVSDLLELAESRLTASQLLDLADREPLRRRFELGDEELTRLQSWIGEAGVRWGLDAPHRAPFKLERLASGTWRSGLDRVLLGVTMTEDEDRLFHGVLPLDDVDSAAIDLAGRFAEILARLERAIDALATPKPIEAWAEAISHIADSLTSTRDRETWQRTQLQRVLDEMVDEARVDESVTATSLTLPEVRALLHRRLEGRPTRANFRTGHLTICTLHPMRSVPHRIVCLLGLDDGAFPRKAPRDGDDLMLDDSHVGERDPRAEDRQLLLDALLAATERLIITYTGNDERTNAVHPPAVPVGELLDVVDATVRRDDGPARAHVLVHHPLQTFDPRNFAPGALVHDASWSFDPVALAGARALAGPRAESGPFLAAPLPSLDASIVELDDLVRFVQHPVRAFLRQRLRVALSEVSDEIEDELRVELDGLQRWAVGQRLLDALLAGIEGRTAVLAELARGSLPPGVLGRPEINRIYPTVEAIAAATTALVPDGAARGAIDVRVALADGRVLSGTVPVVSGDLLLTTTYSRVAARHRLLSWLRVVALTATDPQRAFSAATVGRATGAGTVTVARVRALGEDAECRTRAAQDALAALVDLFDRDMREPLPLYCETSAAYAQAAAAGQDPVAAARRAWKSEWNFHKEDKDLEHQLVLGGVRRFEELLEELPRADEQGAGWDSSETTRFGRLARRMWDGLLAHEEVTTQ
jgi:exodeoxyribonuclease V gamma subunit